MRGQASHFLHLASNGCAPPISAVSLQKSPSLIIEKMKNPLIALTAVIMLSSCATERIEVSAYSGQEGREIKALAPSEIAGLLAGKGLGYAKSAELNGYPGPAHVLELKNKLELTANQLTESEAIFKRMDASAKLSGAALVKAEQSLEILFRSRKITPELLQQALDNVAAAQAKVRIAHLIAHVEQTSILTQVQIIKYNEARGYSGTHLHSHLN